MNFNDFASQMQLKYRVALAIAILKTKPENLLLDQHINQLKAKITETEMDYDSDVTVCSDDFLMDDDEVIEESKISKNVEEANLSMNILEGFDLEEFVDEGNLRDKDSDTQRLSLFEGSPPDKEVNEASKNCPTQSTFCESAQSQSLLNEFELVQSSMTFCETETVKDKRDCTNANIITKKENIIKNNNINIINNPNGPSQSTHTYDSQKTQLYSLQGFCEDFTHVSESQSDFWIIKNNHLYNNPTNKSADLGVVKEKEVDKAKIYNNPDHTQDNNKSVNLYKDNTELVLSGTQKGINVNINEINANKILHEVINENHSTYTSEDTFGYVNKTNSNNINGTMDINVNEVNAKIDLTETFPNFDNTENTNICKEDNTLDTAMNYDKDCNDPYQNQLLIDDDRMIQEDSQSELIPFKVIEELNRVKSYLNRKDRASTEGYATDSGYRSDSQSRSSTKSLHSTDAWINQSAHCLLRFLMGCPIVLRTRDISIEISRTLGRLIDKLHDEEKYPSFLEEILDTVEKLLRDIYEEDSYVEDSIFKKDVDIHKLFHLNRSHHIIKYTLDKITQLLETLLSRITEDSILELTDTVQMENLCYIFHILEHIIKRYAVTKDILSQNSTQSSQCDEKSLKRSSLTDVWRKRWNPNYKSESQQSNPQTKCAETACSEILNKIIVKAMDSYSIVSFAALQCYNLLQS